MNPSIPLDLSIDAGVGLPRPRGLAPVSPRRVRLLCLGAAAAAAAAAALLAHRYAGAGSALQRMFDPSRAESLIPVAILAMFFFGLALLFHRARRLAALRRVATREQAQAMAEAIAAHGPRALCAHLEQDLEAGNPVAQRVHAVLRQWLLQPGRAEAELALQQQVQADQDTMANAQGTLHNLVWALPVLGLIGTVIGIASSVDGFSNFLGGDIDDIRAVKRSLVSVTGGLSFAFLLTLLGLVTSLVLMFRGAAVQAGEERLLAELQDWISNIVLPAVQRAQPAERAGASVDALAELQAAWREEFRRGTLQLAEAFGGELAAATGPAVLEVCKALSGVSAQVATLGEAVSSLAGTQQALQAGLATSMQTHAAALAEAAAGARELLATVRHGLQVEEQAVATLREAQLAPALQRLAEQIAVQGERTRGAGEQLAQLVQATGALAACHAGVQQGIQAIEGLKLHGTLADLGAALVQIKPVLQHFQRPFVLTAVPVPPGPQAAG